MLRSRRTGASPDELTERQRLVLSLMAQGRSNRAARRLSLTERTVEAHVRAIFDRLEQWAGPSSP